VNSDWEEECRCSNRRAWEEDGTSEFKAVREEVHRFDGQSIHQQLRPRNDQCRSAALRNLHDWLFAEDAHSGQ
jgi:hypothetical protein